MVQELQQQQQQSPSVPDELYNLTQLCEVSLIAGKLRTTDINDIKNYINRGDPQMEQNYSYQYYNTQPYHHFHSSHHVIRPIPMSYDQSTDSDYEKLNYESTKKKWKNDWETNRKYQDKDNESPKHFFMNENNNNHNTQNSPLSLSASSTPISNSSSTSSTLSYLLLSPPSSSISSDDDSSKSISSYSHKVFDRKKQRTFRQLTSDSDSLPGDQDRQPTANLTQTDSVKQISKKLNFCDSNLNFRSSDNNFNQFNETNLVRDNASESDSNSTNKANGTEEFHNCPECGKKYSTSSNLARHRQTHRSLQDKKARRCEICDKVYVSMPAFSMHIRTHNQGCQCPHCGKCFSRPWLLQGHIRTHTGERPFKCNLCSKAFADKSNLRAHIQTHSTTKNHKCSRCGKSFALKSYLYKHEESSCMKNRSKPENKIRNRKTSIKSKKHEDLSNENKPSEQTLEMTLKNQTSVFVKERIKEILEDGHKKTYITLKNRQSTEHHHNNNMHPHNHFNQHPNPSFVENRISVIKSISSVNYDHQVQYDDPRKLITNPTSNIDISNSFSIIA